MSQASNDQGQEPDLVMACAGDIATQEALAATALLRTEFTDLKIRFINGLTCSRCNRIESIQTD